MREAIELGCRSELIKREQTDRLQETVTRRFLVEHLRNVRVDTRSDNATTVRRSEDI